MQEVLDRLDKLLDLLRRMKSIDSYSFRWYGVNMRRWKVELGGKDMMFGWFNKNLVKD